MTLCFLANDPLNAIELTGIAFVIIVIFAAHKTFYLK